MVLSDLDGSLRIYEKAALDDGNVHALYMLGKCYVDGRGVAKNVKKGVEIIKIAAEDGDSVRAADFLDRFYGTDTTRTWYNLLKRNEERMRQILLSMDE